jgi:hypothetical protein
MPDEGNKSEGAESEAPSMNDMIEEANTDLQSTSKPPAESHSDWRSYLKANEGWLQAIAKDEHAQRAQILSQPSTTHKGRGRGRRGPKPWTEEQFTAWDIRHQKTQVSPTDTQYAKGWLDNWWNRFWTAVFRGLGVQ